ncbi:SDR family NAD(P)-dependent oxidoreductase [Alphaproteobacteria bacterium]|nr:SDR family NAD(P)-dependent oxidoreductase [Alphaproteobacteria bacterium]
MTHYFITGASAGIGKSIATKLCTGVASNDAGDTANQVSAVARRKDRLDALSSELSNFFGVQADVTNAAQIAKAIDASIAKYGPINVAILNAGMYVPQDGTSIDPSIYATHMDVNYMGVINALAAIVPHMIKVGGGKIVLISSVAGWRGLPRSAAYGPTKAALISLAESLMFDLRPKNIEIQVICPGFVESEATAVNDFDMPGLMSSDAAADTIIKSIALPDFLIHFPKSFTRKLALLRWLPDSWYFKIVGKQTGFAQE